MKITRTILLLVWCEIASYDIASAQMIELLTDTNVSNIEREMVVLKDSTMKGKIQINTELSGTHTSLLGITNTAKFQIDSGKSIFYQVYIEKEDSSVSNMLLEKPWKSFVAKGHGRDSITNYFDFLGLGKGRYFVRYKIFEPGGDTLDFESNWATRVTQKPNYKFKMSLETPRESSRKASNREKFITDGKQHSKWQFFSGKRTHCYKHRKLRRFNKKDSTRSVREYKVSRKNRKLSKKCKLFD